VLMMRDKDNGSRSSGQPAQDDGDCKRIKLTWVDVASTVIRVISSWSTHLSKRLKSVVKLSIKIQN